MEFNERRLGRKVIVAARLPVCHVLQKSQMIGFVRPVDDALSGWISKGVARSRSPGWRSSMPAPLSFVRRAKSSR